MGKKKKRLVRRLNRKLLQKYHSRGMSCRAISKKMRVTYNTVWVNLKKLGLKPNPAPEERSQAIKLAYKEHLRRGGVTNAEKSAGVRRLDAALRGWFGAGSNAQCDLLDSLLRQGPATAKELAARLGYKPNSQGRFTGLKKILGKLQKSGMVERVGEDWPPPIYKLSGKRLKDAGAGEDGGPDEPEGP